MCVFLGSSGGHNFDQLAANLQSLLVFFRTLQQLLLPTDPLDLPLKFL